MDQTEARLLCAVLNAAGHQVVADNGGGWGGAARSQTWGVRSAKGDATEGMVFADTAAFPPEWLASLRADAEGRYPAGSPVLYRSDRVAHRGVHGLVVVPSDRDGARIRIDCGAAPYPAPHHRRILVVLPSELTADESGADVDSDENAAAWADAYAAVYALTSVDRRPDARWAPTPRSSSHDADGNPREPS